jgi:hypothetical protein
MIVAAGSKAAFSGDSLLDQSGSPILDQSGNPLGGDAVLISVSGAVVVSGGRAIYGSSLISGAGAVSVTWVKGAAGVSAVLGAGSVVAAGARSSMAQVIIAGSVGVTAVGSKGALGSAVVSSSTAVLVDGAKNAYSPILDQSGSPILDQNGDPIYGPGTTLNAGNVLIAGGGLVSGVGVKAVSPVAVVIPGGGLVAVVGRNSAGRVAVVSAAGDWVVSGFKGTLSEVTLSGSGYVLCTGTNPDVGDVRGEVHLSGSFSTGTTIDVPAILSTVGGSFIHTINLNGGIPVTATGQYFEMFAGDSKDLVVTVADKVLTGATVIFQMASTINSEAAVTKTTDDDISITDPTAGEITILFEPEDTLNLLGKYYFEVQVTDADGDIATVTTGKCKIHQTLIQ